MIDKKGEQVGVLSNDKALELAADSGLDLVEVSPNADPPVCRIMDFGKYQYELKNRRVTLRKSRRKLTLR